LCPGVGGRAKGGALWGFAEPGGEQDPSEPPTDDG
jgi:hypothetical protein